MIVDAALIDHPGPMGMELLIWEDDGFEHHIPVRQIASWMELLGYTDMLDVLDAIVHVGRNGEPAVDPETGENVWTPEYLVLIERERAREREAKKALNEGTRDDPRSPRLRSALAARKAVMDIDGCTVDHDNLLGKCQADARKKLGICEPERRSSIADKHWSSTCDLEPHATAADGQSQDLSEGDRYALTEIPIRVLDTDGDPTGRKLLLPDLVDEVDYRRRDFLHRVSGEHGQDPQETIDRSVRDLTTEDITARFEAGESE